MNLLDLILMSGNNFLFDKELIRFIKESHFNQDFIYIYCNKSNKCGILNEKYVQEVKEVPLFKGKDTSVFQKYLN